MKRQPANDASRTRSVPRRFSSLLRLVTWRLLLTGIMVCSGHPSFAGEIRGRVLDENGQGLGQAVVFVQEMPAGVSAAAGERTAIMDQVHKQFVPHVLAVAVGTKVYFPNHDQIHHHVYSFSRTKTFEIPLYKGETAPPVLFDRVGAVKVGCNIHDWMSAIIVVVPTPYYATTDTTGAFVISDLPAGSYAVACWHEGSRVTVDATVQRVDVSNHPEVTFTLTVAPVPSRPPVRGVTRGYE